MIASLKPGILVALRTRVAGGVEYQREDLSDDITTSGKMSVEKWKTTRVVEDAEEYDRAKTCRGLCQSLVRRCCVATDFGLLCPEANEVSLDAAVATARELAEEHNLTASRTRVDVYVLKGRVASTDEEAARGIAAEVRALLDGMADGIAGGDPEAVREAASRARKLEQVLDDASAKSVGDAVSEARAAAREIARRVTEGGEAVATVVADIKRERIDAARFLFIDLDIGPDVAVTAAPARAVDVGEAPEDEMEDAVAASKGGVVQKVKPTQAELDLEVG